MKTTTKLLRMSAATALSLALATPSAMAQTDIYVCEDGTVILGYSGDYSLETGDEVVWQKWDTGTDAPDGAPTALTYSGDPTSVNFEVDGGDLGTVGAHHYRMYVIATDPNSCGSDLSDPVEVYKLPALTLALGAPSVDEYCEATTNPELNQPASSDIIATTSPAETLPAGIPLVYAWTAEHDDVAVPDVNGIGSFTANNASATELTNTFTMNTTTVGTYEFTATVTYAAQTSGGVLIKGGCETASTNTQTVEVTAKPDKPTITFN